MGTNEIKIETGPRREFSTGAERQASSGKGTPVLVPGDAIIDIAKHFEKGAAVYGARNWEKGIPLSELLNSLERHLQQEKMGSTEEPHARALAWNALVYLATTLRIENGLLPAELDDMPTYTTLEERLDKEEIGVTEEVAKEFDGVETTEEVIAINQELAGEFNQENRVDWTKDGKLYCNCGMCFKRGFPDTLQGSYLCDEHKKGN